MKRFSICIMVLAILFIAGCGEEEKGDTGKSVKAEPNTLVSINADKAPALDARKPDAAWDGAPKLEVPVANGINFDGGKTEVTLRSLYSGDEIYFMAQWEDPTESIDRTPWVKQEDGSWKKTPAKEKYEDKLAMIWDIDNSIKDFETKGCLVACHACEAVPAGGDFGKKYTANPGEVGDIWHWKVARTDSYDLSKDIGAYVDDQALDSGKYDPDKRDGDAGRYSDPGSKTYNDNQTDDKSKPSVQWKAKPTDAKGMYYLMDDNSVDFVESDWKAGDRLPALHIGNAKGDRADIMASSNYEDGKWTLVFKRKLVTGSTASPAVDVQFKDLSKTYYFGVAAFDNAQLKHAYGDSALMLKFNNQ